MAAANDDVPTASGPTADHAPRKRGWSRRIEYWAVVKSAGMSWIEDNATRLAASLAFYTMLSLAPLLVIAIKIVGSLFGESAATNQVRAYAHELMGTRAGDAVVQMIGPFARPGAGVIATIISALVLLFSASAVFGELQDSLNTVWEVKPRPGRAIWGIIRERFFSFVLVLGTCFLLLVSLIFSTVLSALTRRLLGENHALVLTIVNEVVSLIGITALFALLFKYLPDAKIRWSHVWTGAVITGVLFTIGKVLLGWYLGRASTTSVYGAAGSLIAILLWVYYSAQILFFGAEVTKSYARHAGARLKPAENAVKVTQEERAQKGMPTNERIDVAVAGRPLPNGPVVDADADADADAGRGAEQARSVERPQPARRGSREQTQSVRG